MSTITILQTFQQQRDYLMVNGFEGESFSPHILEMISSVVDFSMVAKIENNTRMLDPILTVNYDEQVKHLQGLKAKELNKVLKVLEDERVRASKVAMKREKESEALKQVHQQIVDMTTQLDALANKLESVAIAAISKRITAVIKG